MSEADIKNKNIVLCDFIDSIVSGFIVKPEYSTNDNNAEVIVVQETSGTKEVFFDANPIYNYYNIEIFSNSIKTAKDTSVEIGNLIGQNIYHEFINKDKQTEKWQILIKQFANPRTIEYRDIRRVSYIMTMQTIVNRIA